jgi:magnesium-transporting ATPase (P-type)
LISGAAEAVVLKTGLRTKMGSLRSAVENVEIEATPLNRQLNKFGDNLALGIAIICAIVWLVSIPRFDDPFFPTKMSGAFYYAKVGVALGVAAIPEGLPAVITLVLALGTRRLAEQNVIGEFQNIMFSYSIRKFLRLISLFQCETWKASRL